MTRLTDDELHQLKRDNPVAEVVAQRWGIKLRKHGREYIGPCPVCSKDRASKDDARFQTKAGGWVCAACSDGGDVVALVMQVEQLEFREAVEALGGTRAVDPVEALRLEAERKAEADKRERDENYYRERERGILFDIWRANEATSIDVVRDYMALRGGLMLPPGCRVRCVLDMPFFEHGGDDAPILHRGPAMMLPIVRPLDGRFSGLHFTWLDLNQRNGKAIIRHSQTGAVMKSKKVRGHKAGGVIEVVRVADPRQLVVGEGFETVVTVWQAMRDCGLDLAATALWSTVDLGNLAGKAAASIAHPTIRDADTRGRLRARRVPGPDPAAGSAAILIPPCVSDLVQLGDGDSDPVLTRCAMFRGQQRYSCEGRTVRTAWAPGGQDFNDMAMGG